MSAYDFSFRTIDGDALPRVAWCGRPVLIVNTGPECGFTLQYADLEVFWQLYRARIIVLPGGPSNDFGGQEPGSEAEIKSFCQRNYGVDFPVAAKEKVVGTEAHPFYRWVASELGEAGAPRWNFHKYLIGPDGTIAGAWPSRVGPTDVAIRNAIEEALGG